MTDKLEAWTRVAANDIAAEFARSECAGWIETIIKRYAPRASVAAPPPDAHPSCWHCGVILASAPKLRCEDCPDECDIEGCDALGCCAPSPVAATVDAEGSMTPEQLERAALVAESRGIDLETAQELIYLRDIRAIANNLIAAPSDSSIRATAAEIETRLGNLPLSLIDGIKERRKTLYKGFNHRFQSTTLKTDLDYALAFLDAILSKHLHPVNNLCFPKPCVHCNQIGCECSEK